MEQFVPVPASVNNKSLNTQSVTKLQLPRYQFLQNATYQTVSLKKSNKKVIAKADSLVMKFRFIHVSSSQMQRLQIWMV